MTQALDSARAQGALDWLLDTSLPLWLSRGLDRERGGFHESLDPVTGGCDADFRRLRVATRQTYVWAAAMRLGYAEAEEGLHHGLKFLTGPARHTEGGFCNRFDLNGKVTDATRDLYDLAFVAFALAHAYDVTGDTTLRDEADALAALISKDMPHSSGGFHEALPPRLPRRQNPHMHLLEAALAWSELDPEGPWTGIAKDLVALFQTRLFDPATGALPEYFDADLRPVTDDQMVEPGHHFEWVWLLHHAKRLGIAEQTNEAGALYDFAHRFGIGPSGVPHGALALDGQILPVATRIWAPAEWLKAEAVTPGPDRDARVGRAWAAVQRYLEADMPGLWHERLDKDAFVPGPAPATSLYHLVLAIEVMCQATDCHPRPFATKAPV